MKTRHLFTFAFAAFALAFAGCSDDDDVRNVNSEPQPGEKGALVESMTIAFGDASQTSNTRAYGADQAGEGTEGMIYEAFIFAKEANPLHDRALTGDWTVIRITRNENGLVQEVGGINPEAVAKADLELAVNAGSEKEKEWLVKNVAKFNGVRQGDYVYVIANDPNLTLAQATALAHDGDKSEESIKAYTASISKEYLNKLTYYPETGKDADNNKQPNGRFVMAGRQLIPIAPTIPSNGNIDITVGLDRELAKVNFTAIVSTDKTDAACGKVEFQKGDGIVVARIARKASMFTDQTGDWYVPANTCVEDWPINDHSLTGNVYSSFCDATFDGSKVFDGESAAPITDWIKDTTIPAGFNTTNPASNISEYRYSWKVNEIPGTKAKPIYIDAKENGKLVSPMFYVTPNYSNNTNSVTVICTQATYTARGVFALSDMADKHIDAALAADAKDIVLYTVEEVKKLKESTKLNIKPAFETDGVTIPNMLMKSFNTGNGQFDEASDIRVAVKAAIDAFGLQTVDQDTYEAKNADVTALSTVAYEDYQKYMDRFYAAVMIQQRLDNKMTAVAGNKTASTSAEWGNGIPAATTVALLASPKQLAATDSLLAGYTMSSDAKPVRLANPFYVDGSILVTGDQEKFSQAIAQFVFDAAKGNPSVEATSIETRAEYFGNLDAYEYFKGQKLYYRADIADYVDGVSNRITERNMYYVTTGTIQSLGAKSIHDAIYSDQNTMSVNVYVKNWKFSQNKVGM